MTTILQRSFFARSTLQVARDLLGMRLVRLEGEQRLAGLIVETEAYVGEEDLGCHARAGLTPRTQVMYGAAGHAYVYFTYGMHWMFNFVTEAEGFPAAVLLRAVLPTDGLDVMRRRRGRAADSLPPARWTDGPAKLCQALGIDRRCNDLDLCAPGAEIFVESAAPILDASVTIGPRVGLYTVPEPWKSLPWRFRVDNPSLLEA